MAAVFNINQPLFVNVRLYEIISCCNRRQRSQYINPCDLDLNDICDCDSTCAWDAVDCEW